MSPTDSETQAIDFLVFKRRQKDPQTTTKTDNRASPQVITIEEESSEERDA